MLLVIKALLIDLVEDALDYYRVLLQLFFVFVGQFLL
jgi:hypothetical protein